MKSLARKDGRRDRAARLIVACCSALTLPATAMELESANPDLKMRWDNTFKYSTAFRLKNPDTGITNDPNATANGAFANLDDGDRNFKRGMVSNRLDWLSEFDLKYKNFGGRVSGAAWYDTVYNRTNDNNSPGTANVLPGAPNNQFNQGTKDVMGRKAEFLDAYVFANAEIAGNPLVVRAGKHTVVYGETLFFGMNGIAAAQGPMDIVKLLQVPGSQFKEILRPVPQVSAQYNLTDNMTIGGYVQTKWEKSRIPPAGSFLSDADVLSDGAVTFGPGLPRLDDKKGKDSGQYGVQLKWHPQGSDYDFGFYAAQYSDKGPQVYFNPTPAGPSPFSYRLVYARDIKTWGMSVATQVGSANVSAEYSQRSNAPLVNSGIFDLGLTGNNTNNILHPVGDTQHFNISMVQLFPASPLWAGAVLLAELGWNNVNKVTMNAAAIDPGTTKDASSMRVIFIPNYFQVLPGVDIEVPIGLGHGISGKSRAIYPAFMSEKTGDFSIGINALYDQTWKFAAAYTKFLGPAGSAYVNPLPSFSFKQTLADRDFVSLSVSRAF